MAKPLTPNETLALETIALEFAGRGATIADICAASELSRGHAVMAVKRLGARRLIRGEFNGLDMVYSFASH